MITGTRGSELALKQAGIFSKKTGLKAEFRIIRTKGDGSGKSLKELGPGVFTKELDRALLNHEIDLAIHSLKDIPVEIEEMPSPVIPVSLSRVEVAEVVMKEIIRAQGKIV